MATASRLVTGAPVGAASLTTRTDRRSTRAGRLPALQTAGIWGLQLAGLWALTVAGTVCAQALALPIPGNLAAMILLYLLLSLGIVKIAWFDAAGSFLVKHLAFFFIPVAVGVMDAGGLLAAHGVGIALTLFASAVIGIVLAGVVAERLAGLVRRQGEPT